MERHATTSDGGLSVHQVPDALDMGMGMSMGMRLGPVSGYSPLYLSCIVHFTARDAQMQEQIGRNLGD